MQKNTFQKLVFMYDKIVDNYVLEKEQNVIYVIGKCLDIWSNPMLARDFFYEKANSETVDTFREVGATVYADLINSFIERKDILENQKKLNGMSRFEYKEEKRILISGFYRKLENILNEDDIVKNYANPYIKENKLNKTLKHYTKYEECEQKRKRQLKKRILVIALGGWLLIPAAIFANFNFWQSGNNLKLVTSLVNLAVYLVLSIIYIGLTFFLVKRAQNKNAKKNIGKMAKIFNELTYIVIIYLSGLFFSALGAFTFLISAPVIRLLMDDCKRYRFDFNAMAEEIGLKKIVKVKI